MSEHSLHKSWLTAELLRVKSGYADWAVNPKTIWPQWSWERLGALAMITDPREGKKRTLLELERLADKRLKDAGDRGWGALCASIDDADSTWLAVSEDSHPIHMRQWPEQTVKAMTLIMQLQGPRASCLMRTVDAFETLWCHDDQELARWLTGRPWSRGDCVTQVLFEANIVSPTSDGSDHQVWRQLQKAKRHRDARHRLTQEHVDYLMRPGQPRRMSEWFKLLRMLRMYGTVRTD